MFKKTIFCILIITVVLMLFSCLSMSKPKDKGFIADLNPIELNKVQCMVKHFFGDLKPVEMKIVFNPRNSSYIMEMDSELFNKVRLTFSPTESEKLATALSEYLELYKNKKFEVRKPTKKNQFAGGKIEMAWGIIAFGYHSVPDYSINYEFIDDKPYCVLSISSSADLNDPTTNNSPLNLYFTPALIEALEDATDKEVIMDKINYLLTEFEDF